MIKLFEDFNEIHSMCKKYFIEDYTINPDGTIDVDGGVKLFGWGLTKLPLKFGRVSGNFYCADNNLITLDGCPSYVGGLFDCCSNDLTSLKGCPNYVGDSFECSNNRLTSLNGIPREVGGTFRCDHNPLPQPILNNFKDIKYIAANQDDYGIWRADDSFNEIRFDIMMKEKDMT